MIPDFGLIGNGAMLARVRADGVLAEAFYPSIGFFRHLIQSQFGCFLEEEGRHLMLASPEFQREQRYLEDTNVLQTQAVRPGLEASLLDFIHPRFNCMVRTLEVRNTGDRPLTLALYHGEASSVADHRAEFGYNVAYYNRLDNHVVRYRGHPWDNAIEAQVVLLFSGVPQPDGYQCGVSYQDEGEGLDAFRDAEDGRLRENRYAFGYPTGVTSALLWKRTLAPGESAHATVLIAAGTDLFDAEDTLESVAVRSPDQLLGETVSYWREWIRVGKESAPKLGDPRLERLYLRSILLLKLLQDRTYGSFIAAPTLEPDYRYCWPRDAVFEAWALDLCGYHQEAEHFYRWCRRTQMFDGLWYQNHYTDGRRHWAGIQVDQVGSVLWGAWEHFRLTGDRDFLSEMWPTLHRAAGYILTRTDPAVGLVYSEQDLWEETGGFLTYTNAACVAGLEAGARVAWEIGREREAREWKSAADALRQAIDRRLLQNGYYVGENEPDRRFRVRTEYFLDISNLGLAVPFGVVSPTRPEMVNTVQRIEAAVDYPIEGVGRYASDLFMGGNPWSLSAIWLALYFAETGQVAEVRRQLDWCLKHAMLHDFLPEQSDRHTGAPTSATPLGWSHAWIIVLFQRLAQHGVRIEPDSISQTPSMPGGQPP